MRVNSVWVIGLSFGALLLLPTSGHAQQRRKARGGQAIEIHGQVPTPQVVTVRPREVPEYSRQVLVPTFYDGSFWGSILPGYQLVSMGQVKGRVPPDSASPPATAGGAAPAVLPESVVREPAARGPLDSLQEEVEKMGKEKSPPLAAGDSTQQKRR